MEEFGDRLPSSAAQEQQRLCLPRACFTPRSERLPKGRAQGSTVRWLGIPLGTYICYFCNFPGLLCFQHAFYLFAGVIAFASFGPSVDVPPPFFSFFFWGGRGAVCR